jgi:hypothetical protein
MRIGLMDPVKLKGKNHQDNAPEGCENTKQVIGDGIGFDLEQQKSQDKALKRTQVKTVFKISSNICYPLNCHSKIGYFNQYLRKPAEVSFYRMR